MNPQLVTFWLNLALGLVLVLWGRRVFWLFVAAVGFVGGTRLAPMFAPSQPAALFLGLGLGILGALFAVVLQRVAAAIAGAAAGALLASRLVCELGWSNPAVFWAAVVVSAAVAAVLVSVLFDWALVLLTTLSGALLVCDTITAAPPLEWTIGIALVALGIGVQGYGLVNPPGAKG